MPLLWRAVCKDTATDACGEGREMTKRSDGRSGAELADSIPICVWVADKEGNIHSCNRTWREYAGPEVGPDFRKAVPEGESEQVTRGWREAVRSARPREWEQRLRRRDGAVRWHLCRMVPERDESGNLFGWILSATDIDAQRNRAENASRAKDEFLAMVSHELRTPLFAILGWAQLLRTGEIGHQRVGRAVESIERSARTQAKLLEDIFDVCRIVSGKLRVEIRPMDLHQAIHDAVDLVQPAADAKGVTLETSLERGTTELAGDPERLQQVIWNLLSNAIKFTPPAGRIRLSARREGLDVVIEVRDTGVGIPRGFLPHVFDRFRQADGSSPARQRGLGLGLAIVRHLVEAHGGLVSADSEGEAKGATFTVRLPLRVANEAGEPRKADALLELGRTGGEPMGSRFVAA